jgi:hypothetical protein
MQSCVNTVLRQYRITELVTVRVREGASSRVARVRIPGSIRPALTGRPSWVWCSWYHSSLPGAFDVLACCGDDFFNGCNDMAGLGAGVHALRPGQREEWLEAATGAPRG